MLKKEKTQMGSAVANGCCNCAEDLCRFIGQTITIFTQSGGLSGSGFTGVLISADCECIRLLTDFGLPPACPVGSACTGRMDGFDGCDGADGRFGFFGRFGFGDGFRGNPFGSICVIPTDRVVTYTVPVI